MKSHSGLETALKPPSVYAPIGTHVNRPAADPQRVTIDLDPPRFRSGTRLCVNSSIDLHRNIPAAVRTAAGQTASVNRPLGSSIFRALFAILVVLDTVRKDE